MTRWATGLLTIALASGLALTACNKKGSAKKESDDKSGDTMNVPKSGMSGKTGGMTSLRPSPRKAPKGKVDAKLAAAIKKTASCDMKESSFTYKCADYEAAKKLVNNYVQKEKKSAAVIETLSVLAHDKDPKLVMSVCNLLGASATNYAFPRLGKTPGKLSKATVTRLLDALKTAKKREALAMTKAVTYAATIKKMGEPLHKVAKGHSEKGVLLIAVRYSMTYGRLGAFPVVKSYAKGSDLKLAQAALRAPREMYKLTAAEKKAVCPWALTYLSNKDLDVAGSSAHLMVRCKEDAKYVEAMITEGKKRVKAKQWKKPFVWAYRDVCFGGFFGTDKKASEERCQKLYKFLEWVANQKEVEDWYRGWALGMIYYQQRNAKTLKVLNRYKNHKNKEIKKSARDNIKSLKKHYLKKK